MNCPKCGSDATRKYKVVYGEGTYTSETSYQGGIAYSSGKSDLAKQCAPPGKASPTATLLIGLILLLVVVWIGEPALNIQTGSTADSLFAAGFFVGISVVVYLAIRASRFNRKEYPRLLAAWEGKWMCMSCGASFSEGA